MKMYNPAAGMNSRHTGRQALLGPVRVRYPGSSGKYRAITEQGLAGLGCGCERSGLGAYCGGVNGLGLNSQTQSAASTASTGAKAGSMIWPGVGTVIGFAVGAIAGYFMGKKKPTRPSKQDISNCNTVLRDYEALIAPYPSTPIGRELGEDSIKAVWMCHEMVVAGTTPNPLFLEGNWLLARDMAIEAVKKTFTTPAGTQIVISTAGRRDRNGKAFRLAEVKWINGEANSMNLIAEKLREFFLKGCLSYHKMAQCTKPDTPTWRHSVLDLVDWVAATQIPQITRDADAAIPGAPVSTLPVLTAPPPKNYLPVEVSTAPPPILIATAPPPGVVVPAAPGAPSGAYEQQLAAQLAPLMQQLLNSGQDQRTALTTALSTLAQRGVEPTLAVQTALANQVQSLGGLNPWLIGGGAFVLTVAFYSLAQSRRK